MDWLITYFDKNQDDRIEIRRFFNKSEDYIDGYMERLQEEKKNLDWKTVESSRGFLIVTKERMD